jgi:uncharacterized protein
MKVLITGGAGLIGRNIAQKLISEGHSVRILSRKKQNIEGLEVYRWNYETGYLENGALDGVEVLVHLAGEGIATKKWTQHRKQVLIESRVKSLAMLAHHVKGNSLKALIGGSAIGFYGGHTSDLELSEDSPAGNDFLATCTLAWEKAEEDFAKKFGLRLVKIRIGMVLSLEGGALPRLVAPIRYHLGAALGTGKQWISWIHIYDLTALFYKAIISDTMAGVFNAVSLEPVTNKTFTNLASKLLKRFSFLPNIPAFVLKILLGEMAILLLGSTKVKNKNKLPIVLKFPNLKEALEDIFTSSKTH